MCIYGNYIIAIYYYKLCITQLIIQQSVYVYISVYVTNASSAFFFFFL